MDAGHGELYGDSGSDYIDGGDFSYSLIDGGPDPDWLVGSDLGSSTIRGQDIDPVVQDARAEFRPHNTIVGTQPHGDIFISPPPPRGRRLSMA